MFKSPYATRLTVYGERNPDNNKPFKNKFQRMIPKGDKPMPLDMHKETPFKPTPAQIKHAENYYAACGERYAHDA